MQESLTQLFLNLNLEGFTPYLENTTYLVLFFIFLTVILFYLISYLAKFFYNSKDKSVERKKPSLNEYVLSITENGYGKRSSLSDFRVTNRGGKGIIGIVNSKRNGNVTSNIIVTDKDQIILSTDKGRVIRVQVKEIRIAGRNTQGVRIIKLSGEEKVVSAIKIEDNID